MKKTLAIEHTFIEHSFYQRFSLAKEEGFAFVELGDWTELEFSTIHVLQKELSMGISAISGSSGHTLTDPGSHDFFLEHLSQSIAVARSFGCANLTIAFAPGARDPSGAPVDCDRGKIAFASGTLMDAVKPAAKAGMTLQLKPTGSPGRPVSAAVVHAAAGVVRAVGSPALRLLYDATVMQRCEGDALGALGKYRDIVGYVHVSNPPEGDGTVVNYSALRDALANELRFTGFVGFTFAFESRGTRRIEAAQRF